MRERVNALFQNLDDRGGQIKCTHCAHVFVEHYGGTCKLSEIEAHMATHEEEARCPTKTTKG